MVELGYRLTPEPLIVSPHHFGVPQLRERVVILGIYDHKNANKPLKINVPKPMSKKDCNPDSILDRYNMDVNYWLTNREREALDIWDEFYKGIKEKTLGFPIWLDWFKVNPYEYQD